MLWVSVALPYTARITGRVPRRMRSPPRLTLDTASTTMSLPPSFTITCDGGLEIQLGGVQFMLSESNVTSHVVVSVPMLATVMRSGLKLLGT
jgi:hypothetical protein